MKRWTIKELKEIDDFSFAVVIMNERKNSLTNYYSPLNQKICHACTTIINAKRTAELFQNMVAEMLKRPDFTASTMLALGFTDEEASALIKERG